MNAVFNGPFIKESWRKCIIVLEKKLLSNTVFKIGNNKRYLLSTKSAYSELSCETEDQNNENSSLPWQE